MIVSAQNVTTYMVEKTIMNMHYTEMIYVKYIKMKQYTF
jgi:hypothetical protein